MKRRRKKAIKTRCPQCQEKADTFTEHWRGQGIDFEATVDGFADMDDAAQHSTGDPYKVTARCTHGHRWRVKGAFQISELDPTNFEEIEP